VALSRGPGLGVVALRVGQGDSLHALREIAVGAGIKHQMPVIGHRAVSQNAHGHEIQALLHQGEKILIMRLGFEQPGTKIGPVSSVVNHSTQIHSPHPTHHRILPHLP
jgi:hypothetical protein